MPAAHRSRVAAIASVALAVSLGACASTDDSQIESAGPGSQGASATATATNGSDPGATTGVVGEPVGAAGDPCALITPAEVQAAFGQTVSAIKRLAATTDEDGTSQQCALTTNGTPMDTSAFAALSAMASGMSGQKLDLPQVAAIGVVRVTTPTPVDTTDLSSDELPPGSKKLTGVGVAGVVLAIPKGGVVVVLMTPTTGFYIYDLEGRAVPAAQMEQLAKAAAARM